MDNTMTLEKKCWRALHAVEREMQDDLQLRAWWSRLEHRKWRACGAQGCTAWKMKRERGGLVNDTDKETGRLVTATWQELGYQAT
jgi:hypothetical protein